MDFFVKKKKNNNLSYIFHANNWTLVNRVGYGGKKAVSGLEQGISRWNEL